MAENRSRMMLLLIVASLSIHGGVATVGARGSTDRWVRRRLLLIGGTVDGKAMKTTVVVAKDGSGNYTTITEALAAAPAGRGRYGIFVKAGVYMETVNITRRNVVLWGEGIGKTVITGSRRSVLPNRTDMPSTATVSKKEADRFTVDSFINVNQWVPNLVNGQHINYTHGLI